MMRGWIITLVVATCTADSLLAQDGTGMRSRYQPPQALLAARPRYQADPKVRPAAVAAEQARRTRATNPHPAAKSGGLFGKLRLPNLLPESMRGDGQQTNDAPLPYDPAELGPQQRPSRNTQNARNMQSRPGASRAATPSRQQPASRAVSAPAPRATAPTSQIARQSPALSTRRNELAEALSDLVPSQEREAAAVEESEPVVVAEDNDIAPPTASDAEELPSYLRESQTAVAPKTAAAPRTATRPSPTPRAQAAPQRDLRDALLSEDAEESETDETEELVTESVDPIIEGEGLSAPPMPSTAASQPAAPRAAIKRDIGAAFRARPTVAKAAPKPAPEVVGEVAAEAPNAAFKPETQKPAASTARIQTNSSIATPAAVRATSGVLFSSSQPIILSNIEGPQRIVVGRQAEYRVTIENRGDVAARDVVASIAAPPGAEVVDASASNGTVERASAGAAVEDAGEIKWQLYELPAGAAQTLTLQLIPRSGREMQLGVQLTHAPTGGQATVEIQEPKLAMEIAGPADVLFGKSQRYALTLSNPGNGAAEDISIELTPPGGDKSSIVKHKVGTLAPGESKKIELELTAREAGELKIQAAATAAGDLKTEAIKMVLCRKAELQVDWRGPDKKYAGAVATYYLRVRNPGTAAAEQVAVKVNLPAGTELIEASEGHEWDADRRVLLWKPAGLEAGAERFMEVQCRMSQPGVNKMELSAQTANGDLSDAKSVPVTVEALADLKLDVSDPKGVVPVGEMATYEVRIRNRGMTAAKGVNIVAMFSEGIDPSHVEGGQHTIRDGRVTFRTFDLAAGGETVLKIHAKASQSGTHIFRTEVACEELEVKLAAEETTRFFTDDQRWADASTAYADETGTTTR
ncbi:MAG: DUF11 domain-containing protein [Pirellulales bacterium]|nr:DUF11 domain-containing protein [Pirellulales bacterium]